MWQAAMSAGTPTPLAPRARRLIFGLYDWIEILVFAVSFILILFTFFLRVATVRGPSMESTLTEGDVLLISNLFYEPAQGDVIVFEAPQSGYDEPLVKRVIATGGQTVDIDFDTWTVTVDGKTLDESGYLRLTRDAVLASDLTYPYTVPEDAVFVMGDNRNHSVDSRSNLVGPVRIESILGRVVFRVFPFAQLGTID